ncbi:hypothetical protein OUZ56_003814 [Daphnia magna]|uniref:Uncharacterized protein n=1 Tax=Daphnia magna TaxID=35525 RepID=A0ABQ9YMV3_9CRUS|nr:hypothetical protein OUZ56_003814 [Daphnia magna]
MNPPPPINDVTKTMAEMKQTEKRAVAIDSFTTPHDEAISALFLFFLFQLFGFVYKNKNNNKNSNKNKINEIQNKTTHVSMAAHTKKSIKNANEMKMACT